MYEDSKLYHVQRNCSIKFVVGYAALIPNRYQNAFINVWYNADGLACYENLFSVT